MKHTAVGTELTQAEYEGTASHVFNSQQTGDIVYASSASQLTRLGIGSTGQVLKVTGGVPAWGTDTTNVAAGSLTGTTMASNVVTSSLTTVAALNSGSITSGFGTIDTGSSTITTTGAITGGSLDVNGGSQFDGTVSVGVDDTGYDVKFFGATASSYMLYDASADDLLVIGGKIGINDTSPGQTFSLAEMAETNIIYQRTFSDTTGQHNKFYMIKSHSDTFEANATTVDTEVMGEFKFYGVNGAGTPASVEVGNIKVQQQGTAGASYNASDIIFSTSTASAALAEKMRLSSAGVLTV